MKKERNNYTQKINQLNSEKEKLNEEKGDLNIQISTIIKENDKITRDLEYNLMGEIEFKNGRLEDLI